VADDQSLQPTTTSQPKQANLRVGTKPRALDEDEWSALGVDLNSTWIAATSAREAMNENLAAYSALYNLEVEEQDDPWVGSANLVIPIIPAELESLMAYVAAQVFVQRLVIVSPADDDPETARMAPMIEKFYNAELRRKRFDGKTPLAQFLRVLQFGLRDGTAPMSLSFTERIEPKMIASEEPVIGEDDKVQFDDDGGIKTERVMTRIEEVIREATFTPRELKEWYLVPAESTSIQTALGIGAVIWMNEKELKAKVKEGTFRPEAVEQLLSWVTQGTSDVSRDQQGTYDKTAGGQIQVGMAQGSLTSKFFKNRGPAQVVRFFTEQFDMDDDGVPEKNIMWFSPHQPLAIGFEPYEYAATEWPDFVFNPFPRPENDYGFALPERLADIVAEANSGRNQRRNYIDLCILPILLERDGDMVRDKDQEWGPGVRWRVEDVEKSLKWFAPPPLSPDSFSDESRLDVYTSKISGQNAPALGAQSGGRRSATESRQQQLAQSVRANLVAMFLRQFLRDVVQFWHKLNRQYLGVSKNVSTVMPDDLAKAYGDKQGGEFTLPPAALARNFNIDIAGLSDPIDAPSRRQEFLGCLGIIAKVFPWIVSDPLKAYFLAEELFQTFQLMGIERFIGTVEEAKGRQQQMAAQAAAQAGGAQPGAAAPGGQPSQNGAPPPPVPAGASA
jgi:hypothetical protein